MGHTYVSLIYSVSPYGLSLQHVRNVGQTLTQPAFVVYDDVK